MTKKGISLLLLCAMLSACGGGGGGGGGEFEARDPGPQSDEQSAANDLPRAPDIRVQQPLVDFSIDQSIEAFAPTNDGGGVTVYSISPSLPEGLNLDRETGQISGRPTLASDRREYTLVAINSLGSSQATFYLGVKDHPPKIAAPTPSTIALRLGQAMTPITVDSSGGAVDVYSLSPELPEGLTFDAARGEIYGSPAALSEATDYTLVASNETGRDQAVFNLSVVDRDIVFSMSPSEPLTAALGEPFNLSPPASEGGAVLRYSVSPDLPAGLSLDPVSGQISGTPSQAQGATTYTLSASNSAGEVTTEFSLGVEKIEQAPDISLSAIGVVPIGVALEAEAPQNSGGTVQVFTVSPSLPPGLQLNASTGQITGTPTEPSDEAEYMLYAINARGSDSVSFKLGVINRKPDFGDQSSPPLSATVGTEFEDWYVPTPSAPVDVFAISPSLPKGMRFDTKTGLISGWPLEESPATEYTISASNDEGSAEFKLSIATPLPVAVLSDGGVSAVTGTRNSAIDAWTPQNAGGAATFSIAPDLPDGLALDASTGQISGTPSAILEKTDYTLSATNSGGVASIAVSVTINDIAPILSVSDDLTATVGAAISGFTIANAGGPALSLEISPALPAGLSIDQSSLEISGTPSAIAAKTAYRLTATNSGGTSSPVNFNITINDKNVIFAAQNTAFSPRVGDEFEFVPALDENGGAALSFSISPDLPSGLSLDSTSGKISGTPSATQASTSYTLLANNSAGATPLDVSIAVLLALPDISTSALKIEADRFAEGVKWTPVSSGGSINGYSIDPALPAGLSFDSETGVISGASQSVVDGAEFSVTASNDDGESSVVLSLHIKEVAPNISGSSPASIETNRFEAIQWQPTSSAGDVTSYSASGLPDGLSVDASTGIISGAPIALTSGTDITLKAENAVGTSEFVLRLVVNEIAPNISTSAAAVRVVEGQAAPESGWWTPTHSGGVATAYSISDTSDFNGSSELSFDTLSGVIGAMTASSSKYRGGYQVRATNDVGASDAFDLTINVVEPPPVLVPLDGLSIIETKQYQNLGFKRILANTGGDIGSVSAQDLPAGLTLTFSNSSTPSARGIYLSGTPEALSEATEHTIIAHNTGTATDTGLPTYDSEDHKNVITLSVGSSPPDLSDSRSSVYPYTVWDETDTEPKTIWTPVNTGSAVDSYSIDPAIDPDWGLSFDTSTGAITGLARQKQSAESFVITATNAAGSDEFSLRLGVRVEPVRFAESSLRVFAGYGVPFSWTPTTTGGEAQAFALEGCTLPSSMSFDTQSGTISGTPQPSEVGTSVCYIKVSNDNGSNANRVRLRFEVTEPAPLISTDTSALVLTKGTAMSNWQPVNSGGAADSYSISPPVSNYGLSFDTSTGAISGTPDTILAQTDFTVTAHSNLGNSSLTLQITVNDVAPIFEVGSGQDLITTSGVAYTWIPPSTTAAGGTPVRYSLNKPLPPGLSLDETTGRISVDSETSVITEISEYQMTAHNSGGDSAPFVFQLELTDKAPRFSANEAEAQMVLGRSDVVWSPSLHPTRSGTPTSYALSDTNGDEAVLPSALSFDGTTGQISGAPAALHVEGTEYTLSATNRGGSATQTLTLKVVSLAPDISGSSSPLEGSRGTSISLWAPVQSGGGSTYSANSLPAGLVLDETSGQITGTPLESGSNSVRITARNSGGTDAFTLSIIIAEPGNVTLGLSLKYQKPPVTEQGLDYSAVTQAPIAGIEVTVRHPKVDDASKTKSIFAKTDNEGRLVTINGIPVEVPKFSTAAISAAAQSSNYGFVVLDNQNGNEPYRLEQTVNTGSDDLNLDILATLGWDEQNMAYDEAARQAGPFAIASTLHFAAQYMDVASGGQAEWDDAKLDVHFSPSNTNSAGARTEISHYSTNSNPSVMYVLGGENSDTDEFDPRVLVHHYAHHLVHAFSRLDPVAGKYHNDTQAGDILDARIAFTEGFAEAYAALVLEQAVLRGSQGSAQSVAQDVFDVESGSLSQQGFYNAQSVAQIINDLFDAPETDDDSFELSSTLLYQILESRLTADLSFITVFNFIDALKIALPDESSAIDSLLALHNIDPVSGILGAGQTDPLYVLPPPAELALYTALTPTPVDDQSFTPSNLCSYSSASSSDPNSRLLVHRFLRVELDEEANWLFAASPTAGAAQDLKFDVYRVQSKRLKAQLSGGKQGVLGSVAVGAGVLREGTYLIDVWDQALIDSNSGGPSCFDFTVKNASSPQ